MKWFYSSTSQAWDPSTPCRLPSACTHRATLATLEPRPRTTPRTLTWKERWSSRQTIPCGRRRWGPYLYCTNCWCLCVCAVWEGLCVHQLMHVLPESGEDPAVSRTQPAKERSRCWRPSAHHSNALCLRGGVGWVMHLNRLLSVILHKKKYLSPRLVLFFSV